MSFWDNMRNYFRNWGGRFSGRYRERTGIYEETSQWLKDMPELSQYENPYAKADDEFMSPHDQYRTQLYKFCRALYYGDHFNALRFAQFLYRSGMLDDDLRLGEVFGRGGVDVLFICMNLFALTTDTFADLMSVALEGVIPGDEKNEAAREAIKRIRVNSGWGRLFHRSIITGSYKGDLVWTVHSSQEKRKAWVRGRRVDTWFPIIDPTDRTRFSEHHFCSEFKVDKTWYIAREMYKEDKVELDVRVLDANRFGAEAPPEIYQRVFKDQAREWPYPDGFVLDDLVLHVPNKIGDDNDPFGDSDYGRGVLTLADELNHRMTQLGHQLDKHGNLWMSGPDMGGEEVQNPSNDNRTNKGASGRYIIRDDADVPEPKVVEIPTGAYDVMVRMIELITEEAIRQMRMSPRLLGYKKGAAEEAFDTLRLACVNTLLRNVGRTRYLDPAIKRAFESAMKLEVLIKAKDAVPAEAAIVGLKWGDGFPVDPEKRARIWQVRTANAQTGTVFQAVRDMDGEDNALETVEAIEKEKHETMINATGGRLSDRARERGLNLFGETPAEEPEINAGHEEPGQRTQAR